MPTASYRWSSLNVQWLDTQIAHQIEYPHDLPTPHAFAGLLVEWGASDIPSHLASQYFNPNPPTKRTYYATFVSGEGDTISVIVLTIQDGEIVSRRIESFPSVAGIRLVDWLKDPGNFLPGGVSLGPPPTGGYALPSGTGWIGNAFSFLTYIDISGNITPVIWVGFFYVKDSTIVSPTTVRLCFCGIPIRYPGGNAVFAILKPEPSLVDISRPWVTYPLARTASHITFPIQDFEWGYPSPVVVYREPAGSRLFCHLTTFPHDGMFRPIVDMHGLHDVLTHACYSPSRVFSNFNPVYGGSIFILSPYAGIYAISTSQYSPLFVPNFGSEDLLIPSPYLLGGCLDDYALYGGDPRGTYIAVSPPDGHIHHFSPSVVAYSIVKESTGFSFRRAHIDSSISEAYTLSTATVEWKQYLKPPLQVWSLENKGYILWENRMDRVDFVNKVRSLDIYVSGGSPEDSLLYPCSPTFPTYLLAALPFYYGSIKNVTTMPDGKFYLLFGAALLPLRVGRVSPPMSIPTTHAAVLGVYLPTYLFPSVDKDVERSVPPGALFILERGGINQQSFPIEPLNVSQLPSGEIRITFNMPITEDKLIAFAVQNPPYPSYPITKSTTYIIADSVINEYGWEKEVSTDSWEPFRGALKKESATSPPFRVRVTVYPQYSRYVRVIAYRV